MPRTLLIPLLFSSALCAQNAYCVDTNLDILYSLDLSTGAVTAIGSTLSGGVMGTPADLCWRDSTSEIWTIDLAGGEAGTIDPTTGLFTTVWNTGVSGWQGMAWDHTTSQFYCHNQNDQLHRLDPTTGVLTLVGTLASTTPLVTGIDIDATGRLWAVDFAGAIFEIDKNTGLAIGPVISTLPVNNLQSLSIDPTGVWYGISTATDSLYTIDPITGVCTLVGPNTGTGFVKGMVIAAAPAPGTATNTSLGLGCGKQSASFYENFAAAAGFDLDNTVLTMFPTGSGYVVVNNVGAFLPVGSIATPVSLALTDDSEVVQTFTTGSFPGATAFNICSNGYVSIGSNGTGFTPDVAAFLNATNTSWRDWHDYNPAIAGSGQVKYEESAAAIVVTWDGVWDFGGTTAANANTFQMQFYPSGQVTFAFGTMSHLGNGHLVGYSPGGNSADPGNTDLSALGAGLITLSSVDVLALGLSAATRPLLGTNWNLTTGNIPATGFIGVDIFGVADANVPDLAFLGMPGCQLRSTLDVIVGPWVVGGATHNYSFAVPALPLSLIGVDLFTQSAVFQVPPVNAFGAITSNGIKGTLGNL